MKPSTKAALVLTAAIALVVGIDRALESITPAAYGRAVDGSHLGPGPDGGQAWCDRMCSIGEISPECHEKCLGGIWNFPLSFVTHPEVVFYSTYYSGFDDAGRGGEITVNCNGCRVIVDGGACIGSEW